MSQIQDSNQKQKTNTLNFYKQRATSNTMMIKKTKTIIKTHNTLESNKNNLGIHMINVN